MENLGFVKAARNYEFRNLHYNSFQEFVYVLARIANMKIDPEELMRKANNSGLVRYLFGDDLKGKLDDTSQISSPSQYILK